MSLIADQVSRLDTLIDRFQLRNAAVANNAYTPHSRTADETGGNSYESASSTSPKVTKLKSLVRTLSVTSNTRPLLKRTKLLEILRAAGSLQPSLEAYGEDEEEAEEHIDAVEEADLEWLLVGKAAVQTYGLILGAFLEQTIPLSDDIWYWDEVLGSYAYTGLYTLQTSPIRLRQLFYDTVHDVRGYYASQSDINVSDTITDQWSQFYTLVQQSVRKRSLATARSTLLSPFSLRRSDIRRKQKGLKKMRELSASGLGLLVNEGFSFDTEDDESDVSRDTYVNSQEEWKSTVAKTIALMEHVLNNVNTLEFGVAEFEDGVFTSVENESEVGSNHFRQTSHADRIGGLTDRLVQILEDHIPTQQLSSDALVKENGRPSRLIRYWIPSVALLFSLTTILRIIASRKAEIITWVREFGGTVVDFWRNWVIEPTKKLIGTIRHDEASEVAIMSKSSLEADRASLERMVVDFAADHPDGSAGKKWTDAELLDIRTKVKEGDLTPVLKAYERDLQKPFMGAVRGDLVRALLIQIQKTKVDVEVAMRGIDNLLKSQELVFGFVGLTPGILVTVAVSRWISGTFGSRKGYRQDKRQGEILRVLRNVDRVINSSTPSGNGMLSYKDHGLLLCEIHVLRQKAVEVIPSTLRNEFLEDINDLADIRTGVERQARVVERIRWAYAKWLR